MGRAGRSKATGTGQTTPESFFLGHTQCCLLSLSFPLHPRVPVRKHLLGSCSPAQKLFADAGRRFPLEAPGEAVFLCSHCFQTGQDGWWEEARPRETVFLVPKRSQTCDGSGQLGGEIDPSPYLGPGQGGARPRQRALGTGSLAEGGVEPLTTGFLPALQAAIRGVWSPNLFFLIITCSQGHWAVPQKWRRLEVSFTPTRYPPCLHHPPPCGEELGGASGPGMEMEAAGHGAGVEGG